MVFHCITVCKLCFLFLLTSANVAFLMFDLDMVERERNWRIFEDVEHMGTHVLDLFSTFFAWLVLYMEVHWLQFHSWKFWFFVFILYMEWSFFYKSINNYKKFYKCCLGDLAFICPLLMLLVFNWTRKWCAWWEKNVSLLHLNVTITFTKSIPYQVTAFSTKWSFTSTVTLPFGDTIKRWGFVWTYTWIFFFNVKLGLRYFVLFYVMHSPT